MLERDVAATLRDTGLVAVVPAHNGAWTILPSGKVGAVQIDDLLVRVNPKEKVGLSRLLFLLGYAADPWVQARQRGCGRGRGSLCSAGRIACTAR